jgi:transcriptional regulator with XRE-family HTH domain
LRKRLGLTQADLARRMDFSRNYISLVESGREPSRRFIKELVLIEQAPAPNIGHESVVREGLYGDAMTVADLQAVVDILAEGLSSAELARAMKRMVTRPIRQELKDWLVTALLCRIEEGQ